MAQPWWPLASPASCMVAARPDGMLPRGPASPGRALRVGEERGAVMTEGWAQRWEVGEEQSPLLFVLLGASLGSQARPVGQTPSLGRTWDLSPPEIPLHHTCGIEG